MVGPLADDARSALGNWAALGRAEDAVTILAGIRQAVSPQTRVVYARGAPVDSADTSGFAEAVRAATTPADLVEIHPTFSCRMDLAFHLDRTGRVLPSLAALRFPVGSQAVYYGSYGASQGPHPDRSHAVVALVPRALATDERRALAAHAEGKSAAAFVLLGRIVHLLADMSIPSHTARAAHDRDPFEWWVEGNLARLAALPVPEIAPPARASDLVEQLARTSMTFTPDHTNHPWGKLLKKRGLRKGVSAQLAGEQAEVLVPLSAGHGAALLAMFFRDRGLAPAAA